MKLQLSYEIMFGYVQKLQIAHLIKLSVIINFPLGHFLGLIDSFR